MGRTVHFGRKTKGRVVFLGDPVRDQDGNIALFQELSSAPATAAASNFAEFHGLPPVNNLEAADVTSAYLQGELKGTTTRVHIPEHRWPEHWFRKKDGVIIGKVDDSPVCPREIALYGPPDSGGFWEQHYHAKAKTASFR